MYKKYITTLMLLLIFNHVYSQSDKKAPELISINISPDTINTKTSSASFIIKVVAKDDISGLNYCNVRFMSPSGKVYATGFFNWGGKLEDTAIVKVDLPQFSENGVWKLDRVYFEDKVSNVRNYFKSDTDFKI